MDETTPTGIAKQHHHVRRMGHGIQYRETMGHIGKPIVKGGTGSPVLTNADCHRTNTDPENHPVQSVLSSQWFFHVHWLEHFGFFFLHGNWSVSDAVLNTPESSLHCSLARSAKYVEDGNYEWTTPFAAFRPDNRTRSEFTLRAGASVVLTSWTHDGCKMDLQLLFPQCGPPVISWL